MSGFDRLRLALVGPLPPPAGGMANQTRQLARLMSEAGALVEIVQTNAPYRPVWTGRVPMLRAVVRLLPYLWRLWQVAGRSQVVHVMANSGWSWHLFAAPAIWMARLRGVPVVVNYRGGQAESFLARWRRLVAFTLAHADRLVVPSGFLEQVFARAGLHAEVVANIIDLHRFRPASGPPAESAHILVARNLEPIYDNASAIQAVALLRRRRKDVRMTIAGTGPEEARLRALVSDLGLDDVVRFAGRLEQDEIASLLQRSAVALNPSLVDNMPNSVLEALASGVPVVSCRVGGVPYIVQDGKSALLVPAGDAAAMAQAIQAVLDNPELACRLREAGLVVAQQYGWQRISGQWAALYRKVIGQRAVAT